MKKIFTLFAAMAMMAFSYAQPANGSYAPDFNLYEINKTNGNMVTDQTISLYGMLNDYKVVYIDVSATTCGPCYNFHSTGTLEGLYNNYGPNSSVNDTRVLFVEGASTGNSWAAINGSAGSNYWDCTHSYGSTTELVPYPVIPLRLSPNFVSGDANCNYYTFHNGWNISAFPTIMMVCPNRMVYDLYGNVTSSAAAYHNQIASKCPAWNNTNDAMLGLVKNMEAMYYCDNGITPRVTLQNMGSAPLTSATFRITYGSDVQTSEWTGNLPQFATEVVSLSPIIPTQDGQQSMTIEVINANGVADEGNQYNTYTASFGVQRTSDLAISSQNFSSASALGLWTLIDNTDGDFGIYNGALRLRAYHASSGLTGECYAPLMNFSTNSEPTLTFDVAHKRYSTSYSERLQVMVSADCGTNWTTVYDKAGAELATGGTTTSEFNNPSQFYRQEVVDLSAYAGNEHVIIKFVFTSAYGNNVFIDNVNITDGPLAIETVDDSSLAIFPNPVKDVLTINYDNAISQIDVYDINGKLVKTFTTVNGTINLSDLSNGVYMLNIQTEEGLVIRKIVKE
jgi:hypothetical protein